MQKAAILLLPFSRQVKMRFGVIAKYIGFSQLLVSAFMLVSAAVSAYSGYDEGFGALICSSMLTGIFGLFPSIFVRRTGALSKDESYYVVTGSWLFCILTGMLPYLMYLEGDFSLTDALFESVSGFTTTGASILRDIEALPQGLLFWRMSTAWIGGIGIIALFSLLIPASTGNDRALSGVEMSQIARGTTNMKSQSFARMTVLTYVVLTAAAIACLKLAGMRWFDAVTQAMSACSTCGFSTRNLSIASFDSPVIEAILIVFMFLSSLRFVLLCLAYTRSGLKALTSSEVTRTFLFMAVGGTVIVMGGLVSDGNHGGILHCLRESAFQVVSIFTTTGFATADTNTWPTVCMSALVAGSLVCGCSGSTSGGIKVDRAIVGAKSLWRRVVKLHSPHAVKLVRVDGRTIADGAAEEALIFTICYFLLIAAGAILNSMAGMQIVESWTAAVASIGNVGPGLGSIGSMGNYADIPALSKYVSMALMLIGRLEIFPVLYVLSCRRRG